MSNCLLVSSVMTYGMAPHVTFPGHKQSMNDTPRAADDINTQSEAHIYDLLTSIRWETKQVHDKQKRLNPPSYDTPSVQRGSAL